MALFIVIAVVFLNCEILGAQNISDHKIIDIVKRQLRWNSNGYIVSSGGSRRKIDYLQPHAGNVKVLDNRNYMAFTVYMRNGRAEVPNTGIFHFIDSDIANTHRAKCSRQTMHEGAYYHFYNKCPETEHNLVASGYCYQGSNGRGLVYNSYTFNRASMMYLDSRYYLDNTRVVNTYEQNLIKECFKSWKESGFRVNSWKCSTSAITPARSFSKDPNDRIKRSAVVCSDCECIPLNGSQGSLHGSIIIFIMFFLCLHF